MSVFVEKVFIFLVALLMSMASRLCVCVHVCGSGSVCLSKFCFAL